MIDSVLSIFGKDVLENIRVLVTSADGQQPPVLQAINASGVPCPETKDGLQIHFKFNNSALFADNSSVVCGLLHLLQLRAEQALPPQYPNTPSSDESLACDWLDLSIDQSIDRSFVLVLISVCNNLSEIKLYPRDPQNV